ncbi:putative transcription factor B3-Domain family [Helianthus annuus]|nr:putative transcription factor B3-Domain family [Helianthus annuus]
MDSSSKGEFMNVSFVKILEDPNSLKLELPLSYVYKHWGRPWPRIHLKIVHESGKSWTVIMKTLDSRPALADGWAAVVKGLQLQKDSLLVFKSTLHDVFELKFFIDGVCGQSYFTYQRYTQLGLTVIPDAFIKKFFEKENLNGTYEILAAGNRWSVESAKIHNCYAFTDGWPTLCERLKIVDEDLLIFNKIDNVSFQLSVYRDCIPVGLVDEVDSVDDDEVVEISHGQFVDELDKAYGTHSGDIIRHELKTDKKLPDIHKGKGIMIKKELFKPTKTREDVVHCTFKDKKIKQVKKSSPPKKVQARNVNTESEFFDFTRKGEYRLRLPVEVANRAGFKKKRHSLNVQNLEGEVVVYTAKIEKNGTAKRYSVENWQKFMDDNNLIDGMMLDFTFVTSKNTIILKIVRSG